MIVITSVIKNSADVIETMVRGNAIVADRFVFVDHSSTDRTLEILGELKGEGYAIDILSDKEQSHLQKQKMMRAVRFAIANYTPDYIVPLDDDEILCSNEDWLKPQDVKAAIEGLPQENLYYICWRNYIPTEEDDAAQVCVAAREQYCFGDEPEMTKKVLIPTKVITDDFEIAQGNHYADGSGIQNRVLLNDLRIAHYPVRSPEQIASKALVGWINHLTMPDREEGSGYHWERMYRTVKKGGLPSVELMQAMCTLYREHPNDEEHLNVIRCPINLPEECFRIEYTGRHEVNLLENFCYNVEMLAEKYRKILGGEKL